MTVVGSDHIRRSGEIMTLYIRFTVSLNKSAMNFRSVLNDIFVQQAVLPARKHLLPATAAAAILTEALISVDCCRPR